MLLIKLQLILLCNLKMIIIKKTLNGSFMLDKPIGTYDRTSMYLSLILILYIVLVTSTTSILKIWSTHIHNTDSSQCMR